MTDHYRDMNSGLEAERVLSHIKRRSQLFETAIKQPPMWFQFVVILMAIALVLYVWHDLGEGILPLTGIAALLFIFIATNTKITNRRIDAVLALLGGEKLLTRNKADDH
jgi:hypothetical protein